MVRCVYDMVRARTHRTAGGSTALQEGVPYASMRITHGHAVELAAGHDAVGSAAEEGLLRYGEVVRQQPGLPCGYTQRRSELYTHPCVIRR